MVGARGTPAPRGFTLIELIVVMAIVALLVTIALPRYFGQLDRSKEAVLRADLATMRDALDKHFADHGRYPERLEDLATRRYLRAIPVDPITESATTWVSQIDATRGGVVDVRSGAPGDGANGVRYAEW